MVATTTRIQPHAAVAERVLAPGDPGRALRLAQWLIEAPKMLNHHRGLWGYSGPAKADGGLLTIQSTGTGGPSAALVVADLAALGARRIVRVGTALAPAHEPGGTLVARTVAGATAGLAPAEPDARLTAALAAAGAHAVELRSVDSLEGRPEGVTDLQGAAVVAAAVRAGVRAACALVVVESLGAPPAPEAEQALGELALVALGGPAPG